MSLYVEVAPMFVAIREDVSEGTREWVYWHEDEWKENPGLVSKIANAVRMAYEDPDSLKRALDGRAELIRPDGSIESTWDEDFTGGA